MDKYLHSLQTSHLKIVNLSIQEKAHFYDLYVNKILLKNNLFLEKKNKIILNHACSYHQLPAQRR